MNKAVKEKHESQDASVPARGLSSRAMHAAVLSVAQLYEADQRTIEGGRAGGLLMRAAGFAVAAQALTLTRRGDLIVVLCGPGNNGGDGFVAASRLARRGRRVRVALMGRVDGLSGDAALAAKAWLGEDGHTVAPLDERCLDCAVLVIDAVFGAGLNREPTGAVAAVLKKIHADRLMCLAVDVPSGVKGDSGEAWEGTPACVATVTFFRPKPAHYLYPAKALCGRVIVADIGIDDGVLTTIGPCHFVNGPTLWRVPVANWSDHKYTRGHVQVFGSASMSGAARLAIRGARRIGAGLVTAVIPQTAESLYAVDAPGALMWPLPEDPTRAADSLDTLFADHRRNVVVIGPGATPSPATRERVLRVLRSGRSTVLDAGALTAFAQTPDCLFAAISHSRGKSGGRVGGGGGGTVVMTPHDGEYAQLFGTFAGSRLHRARLAAARSGAVVVLKGADTVVASPDGYAVLAPWTAADLATGGSGDVLAGMIGGLLGQGMAPFAAAAAAVWVHADAARRIGAGLIAEDISERIPEVLTFLRHVDRSQRDRDTWLSVAEDSAYPF